MNSFHYDKKGEHIKRLPCGCCFDLENQFHLFCRFILPSLLSWAIITRKTKIKNSHINCVCVIEIHINS